MRFLHFVMHFVTHTPTPALLRSWRRSEWQPR